MASQAFEFGGPWKRTEKGHVDWYYGGGESAWVSLAAAKAGVPSVIREGKTVGVWESNKIVEYVWGTDITDGGLIKKTVEVDVSGKLNTTGGTITGAIVIEEPVGAAPSGGKFVWGYKFFDLLQIVNTKLTRVFEAAEATDEFVFRWIEGIYGELRKNVLTISKDKVTVDADLQITGELLDINGDPISTGGTTSIEAGSNVTIDGSGTEIDPYVINAEASYTDEQAINALVPKLTANSNMYSISVTYENGNFIFSGLDKASVGGMFADTSNVEFDYNETTEALRAYIKNLTINEFDQSIVITSDVLPAEQTKLSLSTNWTAATSTSKEYYSGTGVQALSGNKQGQYYYDGLYFYYFIADDYPIRLGGTALNGTLITDGTITTSKLNNLIGEYLANKIGEGNKNVIRIAMDDVVDPTQWLPIKGRIANAYLIASASEVSTNFNPSVTYVYTCETKIAGGTPDLTTLNTTSTTSQFSSNLAAKGTTVDSVTWFRITAPSAIPAGTKLDLFLTVNIW